MAYNDNIVNNHINLDKYVGKDIWIHVLINRNSRHDSLTSWIKILNSTDLTYTVNEINDKYFENSNNGPIHFTGDENHKDYILNNPKTYNRLDITVLNPIDVLVTDEIFDEDGF